MMKQVLRRGVILTLILAGTCYAEMEWSVLRDIALPDTPRDVAVSFDGTTAYVLCDTSIQIVSLGDRKITGSLPVGGGYSRVAITPSGDELLLTGSEKKQLTVMQVAQVYDIPVGTSPVIGPEKASVTVTAFLDYQCPYCSKAYPLLEQLLGKFPNDAKLVIKHYPLKFHKSAEPASIAALAAARQNKYREFSALLMQNSSQLSEQAIRQAAQQTGLNMEQFDADGRDPAIKKQITDDMGLAARCNVRGVPSIYINGRPIKSYSIESLSDMVSTALRKK
jgi:protein-disulfide isomerase